MQDGEYDKAYESFETYEQHFEMDEQLSLMKCEVLKSCGHYLELREEASILLNQGHEQYDQVVIYFVERLFQLAQYQTVVEIINQIKEEDVDKKILKTFKDTNFEEIVQLLIDLIDNHLGIFNLTLAQIIENEPLHPNVQSLILEYLRLGEWSAEVKFNKIDTNIAIVPTELSGIER